MTPGGTASYAARTARALGLRTAVLTSADDSLDLRTILPDIEIYRVPAATSTLFENRYTSDGRVQFLHARAAPLTPDAVYPLFSSVTVCSEPPSEAEWCLVCSEPRSEAKWRLRVGILHLGPVARECDPALADHISADFLGLTPQGWMRRWDGSGRVSPGPWEEAEEWLPRADAVVLSEEDIGGDEALAARWAAQTRILAITRGARGCSVYADGRVWHLPAFPAQEVDPTGAGDIFAAVFFTRLWRGDDPVQAARRANCIAAISVTRPGLSGTPTPTEVARCIENHQDTKT
ncbi:MAG: PfkB family carbohydrate kinase [Anaerolineae bacterium]|nr:PfkB family carbohydrate kinase [Anaerolineae bacterium]